ncbi:uncharacterized protein LOC144520016 isoform X2 [Sander vitreus]
MSLSLLLLLVCSAQASHFFGTVMTYYPKNTYANGSVMAVLRYKLNFHTCLGTLWACSSGDCGSQISLVLNTVDQESSGEWCQTEGIMTRQVPSNAQFQLLVPSNCQRDFNLLAFDPDGDEVRCRYGYATQFECATCTPPSVLNLSSSCTLSFSPTLSSNEGAYVVQLVMEDFPRQTITLTQTNGAQTIITTNNSISKIPVQFALRVGPAVPSCTEGLYLPKFLPPTPANRAQLYTRVNQVLEINISVVANISTFELLFSGPYNVIQNTSVTGQYTLKWTPSENEDGESHPICFVVQAVYNSVKYHSELRCVIVIVGNDLTTLSPITIPLTTTTSTTPPNTTPQTTTNMATTTMPLTTTTITTLATTTNIPPTTTPQNTTTITTTTPQTTSNIPPTTTPLTTVTIITPTTTLTQNTTTALSTTATITTTTIAAPTTTTNIPPATTPLTTTNITTPTPQTATTAPSTTPLTAPPSVTNVSNQIVILRMKLSSPSPLSEEYIRSTVLQQIKDELVRRGLPSDTIVRLVRSVQQ